MDLETIKRVFERCIREAGVFDRDVPGKSLVEAEVLRKSTGKWLVIAAGIEEQEAQSVFPVSGKRAERAAIPLNVLGGAQASFLFVVRPVHSSTGLKALAAFVTPFAPGERVPFVELDSGAYLRLWDLPRTTAGLTSLRWELDPIAHRQEPMERWLQNWAKILEYNPAHAPSHLHLNSPPVSPNSDTTSRAEHSFGDLRLAVGIPNPLSLILSLAAWLRAN